MREYLNIGPVPPDEACAQVGSDNYHERARKECIAYRALLRRILGPEVGTAELSIKAFPHDSGTYLEVICRYDTDDEIGTNYAFKCEGEGPMKWDDVARTELGI